MGSFCDWRLVEYAYNMPWSLKALHGREKGILRTAMDSGLPYEITWRKKSPYPKTHNPIYMKPVSYTHLDVYKRQKGYYIIHKMRVFHKHGAYQVRTVHIVLVKALRLLPFGV